MTTTYRNNSFYNTSRSPLRPRRLFSMASIARSSMLRHVGLNASPKRFIQSNSRLFTSSALSTASRSPSSISRPLCLQKAHAKILPASARVAAFHATSRRDILPPLPRMYAPHHSAHWPLPDLFQSVSRAPPMRPPLCLRLIVCMATTIGRSNAQSLWR